MWIQPRPLDLCSAVRGYWQQHGTFYEFRTYYIQPHLNAVFLRLTNEEIHLRTAHSELIGYWSVEYKGLTITEYVFHIWKCDSYAQRVSVWAALAQDPKWIEQYISKAMLMLSSQDNEVTYLVPWSKIQKPPKDGVHVLWWYESADQRAAIRHKSHNNARVVAVVKKSAVYLVSQKNKRMFPCAFSPIK
uniref:Protein NipSnap homolog 3A-like n=1 Tax=Sinocyclocheilus rhinocerous TaxID=307959 RepID=A0A673JD74_9TELE